MKKNIIFNKNDFDLCTSIEHKNIKWYYIVSLVYIALGIISIIIHKKILLSFFFWLSVIIVLVNAYHKFTKSNKRYPNFLIFFLIMVSMKFERIISKCFGKERAFIFKVVYTLISAGMFILQTYILIFTFSNSILNNRIIINLFKYVQIHSDIKLVYYVILILIYLLMIIYTVQFVVRTFKNVTISNKEYIDLVGKNKN